MGKILDAIDTEVGSIRKKAYMVVAGILLFRNLFRLHEASLLIFCAAPQSALDYNPNARNAQTIVTEWQLYGTKDWIPGLLQSVYYIGVLIGATVFGQLSDMYGRRIVGMTGYVFLLITAVFMGLSQNWQQLAILRVLLGFCSSQYVADTVLFQELCGKNLWAFNGIILGSALGTLHTLLHLLTAYLFPDWRTLCFVDSAIGMLSFIFYYYIPKSPRWLYSKGRLKEATHVIAKFRRWNGKKTPFSERNKCQYFAQNPTTVNISGHHGSQNELLINQEDQPTSNSDDEIVDDIGETTRLSSRPRAHISDLLRDSSLRNRSLILGLQWITCSFIYYCLTFGAGSFSPNFYFAHLISNLSPLPGVPILMLLMERKWCGRRGTLAICNFVTALSAFATYIVPFHNSSATKLTLVMVSKLGITLSFDLIYVYTPELFPTAVRNVGLGAMSTSARIGGILAPFLAHVMMTDTQTPFILYGVMCTACGFLGLFLPETVGKKIPESMDDIYDQDDNS